MTYSVDLRERVVAFVKAGGTKTEASRQFSISRACIYDWVERVDLKPKRYELTKTRKLCRKALAQHVKDFPDMLSVDRANHFGVAPSSLCVALQKIKITRKKNS